MHDQEPLVSAVIYRLKREVRMCDEEPLMSVAIYWLMREVRMSEEPLVNAAI